MRINIANMKSILSFGLVIISIFIISTSPVIAKEKDVKPAIKATVSGIITLGPVCAVVTYPSSENCGDQPYATTVYFYSTTGRKIKSVTSSTDGSYKVRLPAGTYTIGTTATPPPSGSIIPPSIPKLKTTGPITVTAHQRLNLPISFETGIQ